MIVKKKYFLGLVDGIGDVGVILGQRIHLLNLGGGLSLVAQVYILILDWS